LRNICYDTVMEAAERIYTEMGVPPQILYVTPSLLSNLLKEMGANLRSACTAVNDTGIVSASFYTSHGHIQIEVDREMPEHLDFYFDDKKMLWLDWIFEEIILKGEDRELANNWGSPPQDL